jgi:hypothetical protein
MMRRLVTCDVMTHELTRAACHLTSLTPVDPSLDRPEAASADAPSAAPPPLSLSRCSRAGVRANVGAFWRLYKAVMADQVLNMITSRTYTCSCVLVLYTPSYIGVLIVFVRGVRANVAAFWRLYKAVMADQVTSL